MSSSLRLINETTVSSTVSSVSVENVFSADFDIYMVHWGNATSDVNSIDMQLRYINSSGSVISSSIYDQAWLRMRQSGFDQNRIVGQNHIFTGQIAGAFGGSSTAYIFSPFKDNCYTWHQFEGAGFSGSEDRAFKGVAVLKEISSLTGFQLNAGTDNITSATIRTFGMRVDS
ncbi:MAG: hypothetical protein Tp162SUR384061_6 [Prokaryotic dsDNA virus sp.]|jgi:hypothetical protein|nr:MAG: hypothetical protein Tp162SUR384061_6 [Prokaryotic dsDNA virus sp.]|tara:strand:- start:1652 stop:2167 length:516 start_codon:yes stop_codon:yes gene_type:complete